MWKSLCSLNSTRYKTAIRYIQWRIVAAIDGIYGDETVSLVNEYQKNNISIPFVIVFIGLAFVPIIVCLFLKEEDID